MKFPTVSSSFDAFKTYSEWTRPFVTLTGLLTFTALARSEWTQSKVAPNAPADGAGAPSKVSAAWASPTAHKVRAVLAGAVGVGALGLFAKDLKLIK